MNTSLLDEYARRFKRLKQGGTRYGKAPHKPVFLLTLIELIEKEVITANRITISPELVAGFKENFALLVKTAHKDDFTQPFFYLQSEGFWFLKARPGATIDSHIKSVQVLSERLGYAAFSEDLFGLLRTASSRVVLKSVLLEVYFPEMKAAFLQIKQTGRSYLQTLECEVLNEKEGAYLSPLVEADDEEVRFVRGGLFKRLVPKVYGFTCAISGLKVIARDGSALVEACHIVPISISGDDRVTNGIALCPTLHTAFDRGMIAVDDQMQVLVSPSLAEEASSPYNLRQFEGCRVRLPFGSQYAPAMDNFSWHRQQRYMG